MTRNKIANNVARGNVGPKFPACRRLLLWSVRRGGCSGILRASSRVRPSAHR